MNARLERILIKLARQHAPHLTPPGWEQTGDVLQRIPTLARQLARYNLLVLMAYLQTGLLGERDSAVQAWVNEYGHLYSLLTRNLFPSLTAINAQYADDKFPPLVVIRGEATPVMNVLAGFVTPYVAARQAQPTGSEVELFGLVGIVLDELEAGDLPRTRYEALRTECMAVIQRMLASPVRQITLTPFDRPIIGQTKPLTAPPDQLPEEKPQTPVPESKEATKPRKPAAQPEAVKTPAASPPLNSGEAGRGAAPPLPKFELPMLEDDPNDPPTPTEQLFKTTIPMDTGRFKRRLPIPDLPDDEPDEG
jgi:hypothetical protein